MRNLFFFFTLVLIGCHSEPKDPYLWLEEIQGEKALSFVKQENSITLKNLSEGQESKRYQKLYQSILGELNSPDRLPYSSIRGNYVYNFRKKTKNPRGLYRRMPLAKYLKNSEKWETVVDFDKLAKSENENWVFKGTRYNNDHSRVIIKLSRGGKDAHVIREFDLKTKTFIKGGFELPEGKHNFSWPENDTLLVGVGTGKENLSVGGYPRKIRLWKRGQDWKKSEIIFEMDKKEAFLATFFSYENPNRIVIYHSIKRYESYHYDFNLKTKKVTKLPLPLSTAIQTLFGEQVILSPTKDWKINETTYKLGSLLALSYPELLAGNIKTVHTLYAPNKKSAFRDVDTGKGFLLVQILEDVRPKVLEYRYKNREWNSKELKLPLAFGRVETFSLDERRKDYFLFQDGFLNPQTLFYFDAKKQNYNFLRKLPEKFPVSNLVVNQHFATSKDGTKVPYFIIHKKNIELNGKNPTHIYAYGGFMNPKLPKYSPNRGRHWLSKGGVYVLANIRGGGEYGPRWHEAARREKRQNAFDDFYAVAEDIISRKISSPNYLSIEGGSNGGLLTAVAYTQRPDLYKAVISLVPLTDMKRFHKLLSGNLWIGEYGNPEESADWKFLSKYSPYHNLEKHKKYPSLFLLTSMLDDRVHPGHARKMAAKLKTLKRDLTYYENIEGGHNGSANNTQAAKLSALKYIFLYQRTMDSQITPQ